MKIEKLHQPYIFENNQELNIIVSEIQEQKFDLVFANNNISEDCWKLKILDGENNLQNLVTPQEIEIESKTYYVVAECNGFIDGNKISYVVGVHTKELNTPLRLFLVQGDLDLENKVVTNVQIIDTTRSGFIKNGEIYKISNKEKSVYKNNSKIFDFSNILDSTMRLIGVYQEPKIIITGIKDGVFNSYIYDYNTNILNKIKNKDNSDVIYKCSILGDEENGVLAYTDKVFTSAGEKEHTLNINQGYILENN